MAQPLSGEPLPEEPMTPPPPLEGPPEEETAAPPAEQDAPVEAAEPAATIPDPGAAPAAVLARLELAVTAGFAEVLGEFRDKLALDRFKEEQIEKLHEEVQAFRNGLVLRAVRQVLQGVIRLHDDLGRVEASLRRKPVEELTPERFFKLLAGFQDDVEMLLGEHGVERLEVSGEEFDPRRQTAARTVPADDPAQVGRVAERLRPGFTQGETLLQKERVAVYAAAGGTNEKTREEMVP